MPKITYNKEKLNDTYNWPVFYRELGYYVKSKEEYERSLKFFDKSLSKEPDNIRCLHGRANARAKAIKFNGAMEDIRKILTLDPENIYLKAEKALITYLSCEFEDALVQNYRNVPLRKKPDNFVMGVMHCEDAILNCISERAGKPLRDHFKIIRKIAWAKTIESQRPYVPIAKNRKKKKRSVFVALPTSLPKRVKEKKCKNEDILTGISDTSAGKLTGSLAMIGGSSSILDSLNSHETSLNQLRMPPAPPFPHSPMQRHTTNIDNYLAERYLDKLYQDKLFLKHIPIANGTMIANQNGSKKIKQLAIQGFKKLYNTQEMLRARRPFYFIKYQEARTCGQLDQRQQHTLKMIQEMAVKQADYLISKIQEELKSKKIRKIFECVEKLANFCETTSKKVLPKRHEYMTRMLDMICDAMYESQKFSHYMNEEQKSDRIKFILGLPMDKFPSNDSLANDIKGWYVDWKKMSEVYEKRLFKAETPEELAWLYHGLSKFSFEMKQFEMSRMYARKCITEANNCKKLKWILNAMMMIVRIDIVQKNKNDAENQAKQAKKIAARLKDDEMSDFLDRCISAIEESTVDDMLGIKLLEMREKQIIKLLATQKMKDEAAYLFRRISTLPMNKRMSVMPGFTFTVDKPKEIPSGESKGGEGVNKKERMSMDTTNTSNKPRGVAFLDFL